MRCRSSAFSLYTYGATVTVGQRSFPLSRTRSPCCSSSAIRARMSKFCLRATSKALLDVRLVAEPGLVFREGEFAVVV